MRRESDWPAALARSMTDFSRCDSGSPSSRLAYATSTARASSTKHSAGGGAAAPAGETSCSSKLATWCLAADRARLAEDSCVQDAGGWGGAPAASTLGYTGRGRRGRQRHALPARRSVASPYIHSGAGTAPSSSISTAIRGRSRTIRTGASPPTVACSSPDPGADSRHQQHCRVGERGRSAVRRPHRRCLDRVACAYHRQTTSRRKERATAMKGNLERRDDRRE